MDRLEGAPKVRNIRLTEDKKNDLVNYIHREVHRALQDRSGLEKKWEVWDQQVKSRLPIAGADPKAAKIDVGLTGERVNAVKSRIVNAIFQQDRIFSTQNTEPKYRQEARDLEDLIDYEWNRFDAQGFVEGWLDDGLAFSAGIVKVPYTEEVEYLTLFEDIDIDNTEQLRPDAKVTSDGTVFTQRLKEVKRRVGAFPRGVSIEDLIFPLASPSIDRAEWVCERIWMTKRDLQLRVKRGLFSKKAVDEIGEPQAQPQRLMACEKENHETASKQYEVLEFYTCREVVDGQGPTEIIVWMERHSKQVLRACYNFYETKPRPYVSWCYRSVNDSIYGIPATFILEPLHRAYSASFVQELDAASKANEIILLAPQGSGLRRLFEKGLKGGLYETMATTDQFKKFELSQPMTLNPQLRQQISMHADKAMGLSPYSFGHEQAQRPTATGQVELLEEGRQPLHSTLESFRYAMAKVCEMMLARLRQFGPKSMEIYLRKEAASQDTDESRLWSIFEWPDTFFEESVLIRVKASSAKMNKNLRKQEAMAMLDRIPQVYGTLMQMLQTVNPQNPTAPVAVQLINGFQTVFNEFLIEFDVPQKELLNPPITEMLNYGQMVAQNMAQMQNHIQGLSQQNQQLQFQLAQVSGGAGPQMAGGVPMDQVPQAAGPGIAPPQGQ